MSDAAVPEAPVSTEPQVAAGENGESAAPDQKDDKDKASTGEQAALQQQIQAQLQQQLQSQLQAAAQKGKQANITPEMIQAQAQAMVQAAAQAQAVVAAAKNRGGGLVPMNAAQVQALSQIQAQAIVNARPQTALIGPGVKPDDKPTQQQIQNQIQLQAQALVHAHTQAQISAGIYKGDDGVAPDSASADAKTAATTEPLSSGAKRKEPPTAAGNPAQKPTTMNPAAAVATATRAATATKIAPPAGAAASIPSGPMSTAAPVAPMHATMAHYNIPGHLPPGMMGEEVGQVMDPESPEFHAQLSEHLTRFWTEQLAEMQVLGTDKRETEQDFKNHNDLPLARIKRIMKSDEDVRMISAEAPVLFAKACEMFILEMTVRGWNYAENNKRKTLNREDILEAIQRTNIFDFLVDVIN